MILTEKEYLNTRIQAYQTLYPVSETSINSNEPVRQDIEILKYQKSLDSLQELYNNATDKFAGFIVRTVVTGRGPEGKYADTLRLWISHTYQVFPATYLYVPATRRND